MTINQKNTDIILGKISGTIDIGDNSNANPRYGEWYSLNQDGIDAVNKYNDIIERVCAEKGVNPDWVRSIMYLENAQGWYGKGGELIGVSDSIFPMNIRESLWSDLLPKGGSFDNPKDNIEAGVELIKRIMDNLSPEDLTFDKVATLYNSLSMDAITDYGARALNILILRIPRMLCIGDSNCFC